MKGDAGSSGHLMAAFAELLCCGSIVNWLQYFTVPLECCGTAVSDRITP